MIRNAAINAIKVANRRIDESNGMRNENMIYLNRY